MKTKSFLLISLVFVMALSGCAKAVENAAYDERAMSQTTDGYYVEEMPAMASEALTAGAPAADSSTGVASSESGYQQMIIMNADLRIAVDDPGATMDDIQNLAKDLGGFVVSTNIYKSWSETGIEVPEAYITIRVPAEDLNDALTTIKEMTGDASEYTISETVSGQDVTQEYTDLSSRLRNLEEADDKLTELYDTAATTEDALAIYTQKIQITEQIEVIKGQMQYYEQSSSMSAITVTIVTKESVKPITVGGWEPQGVARNAIQALIDFGKGLVNFLIWLLILIVPVIVVIGAPIFFFVRWLVRRNRRRHEERLKVMAQQKPPTIEK